MTSVWIRRQARRMKHHPTAAEARLGGLLSVLRVSFQPQRCMTKSWASAIVDFYLPKHKIVIEADGGYHDTPEQREKDVARDAEIEKAYKVKVLRFPNSMIERLTHTPLLAILQSVRQYPSARAARRFVRKSVKFDVLP